MVPTTKDLLKLNLMVNLVMVNPLNLTVNLNLMANPVMVSLNPMVPLALPMVLLVLPMVDLLLLRVMALLVLPVLLMELLLLKRATEPLEVMVPLPPTWDTLPWVALAIPPTLTVVIKP